MNGVSIGWGVIAHAENPNKTHRIYWHMEFLKMPTKGVSIIDSLVSDAYHQQMRYNFAQDGYYGLYGMDEVSLPHCLYKERWLE